jgi:hypothetical protein
MLFSRPVIAVFVKSVCWTGKVDCPSCGTPVSSHHFYKGQLLCREIVRHSESAAPQMAKAELLKKHLFTALSLLNQDLISSCSVENVDCEIRCSPIKAPAK